MNNSINNQKSLPGTTLENWIGDYSHACLLKRLSEKEFVTVEDIKLMIRTAGWRWRLGTAIEMIREEFAIADLEAIPYALYGPISDKIKDFRIYTQYNCNYTAITCPR